MSWLRGIAARHPLVVDVGVVILIGLFAGTLTASERPTGADIVWSFAVLIPLIWRRRAPVLVFWIIFVWSGLAELFTIGMAASFVSILTASYALARYRPRRYLWPAVAALAISISVSAPFQDEPATALIVPGSMLAAVILLGAYIQTRRAYLDELVARAARLERERDQQTKLAAAAERSRIAREMHDIVAHNLAVMVALAEGASYSANRAPEQAAVAMNKVSETGRQALGEMRRLLGLLRDNESDTSDAPSPQPGFDDITDLIEQVRAAGQSIALTVDGAPGSWGAGAGLATYRIVQEALTNTIKHAGSQAKVEVRLTYSSDRVEIEVMDDGVGQYPTTSHGTPGQGIPGIIERATSFDGTVESGPRRTTTGWRVYAKLRPDGASATAGTVATQSSR